MTHKMPEGAGFSSSRLTRITRMVQGYLDRGELAGVALTVARKGQTVYQETLGMASVEAQKPLSLDTIYRIASMTKPITSVAIMMLYEEGHFHLNTPVSRFIPGFDALKVYAGEDENGFILVERERPVTMRHLFTHTSGLTYGFNPNDPIDRMLQKRQKEMQDSGVDMSKLTVGDMVAELVKAPLAFQPGTKWRYGNNIEVLGHIVEIISGQTLAEFLQERIFAPLGMLDTGFFVPQEKCDRLSDLYGHEQGKEGLQQLDGRVATELPYFQSGGGGLFSTLPDYARFLHMLVNRGDYNGHRLLSPQTVALYTINHAPAEALPYGFAPKEDLYHAGYGYSLGTRVLMDVSQSGIAGNAGEFGWDGAFGTYFWVDPVLDLYGLMMLQHYPNAYYPIAQQFKQLTYQSLI